MRALVARDRAAGVSGLSSAEMPYPHMAENDVIVEVHAACSLPTNSIGRGHGPTARATTGHPPSRDAKSVRRRRRARLRHHRTGVGDPVIGLTDWRRNGTLAEYVAVEARNLAPLSAAIDHVAAAALPMPGLTAWQGLFDHGHLGSGQTVLVHGAAGGVGSMAVQLAVDAGARVIGSGRTAQQDAIIGHGVDAFLDLHQDRLEDVGEVDVVFDVLGGGFSTAQHDSCGRAARSSPLPNHHGYDPKAHRRSSSSSSPIGRSSRAGTQAAAMGGCAHRGSGVPPRRCAVGIRPGSPQTRKDRHPRRRGVNAPRNPP